MKKSVSVLSLGLMMTVFSSSAFAADFDLDRGIGYKKGRDVESWMDSRESAASGNTSSRLSGSSMGTAIGNLISIKTEAGSHVVLNATQINKGNQTVEVTMNNNQYKNVEEPAYNTEGTLYYSK